MKQLSIFAYITLILSFSSKAQTTLKLDFFTKVPASIQNCGALYTYDTVALEKKKYILLADYQNLGLITINGKQIKLQLADAKTVNKNNISTYNGSGYTVILTSKTISQKGKLDIESGTLQVVKGSAKIIMKIHGQSGCDESKQEGNL